MTIADIRSKYLDFMEKRGHAIVPSSSLVPEGDATTLFTSSGMQPMMPYLLGASHPKGAKIADSQKCFRSQDIEEVGDMRHTTFFEMLGNWSLGDYFKEEQLKYCFEFLTNKDSGLGLDPHKLFVTVFEGGSGIPKDIDAVEIWQKLFATVGIDAKEGERIFPYPAKKNWWSRAGEPENMPTGEPGGPDSEVFYDFGEQLKLHENSQWKNEACHVNCDCGRYLEIGNSVFMQYQKQADGSLVELPQKNIDFGGGLTRLEAAVNNDPDMFRISSLFSLIQELEKISGKSYEEENKSPMRIIADHLTAAVFLIKDGVTPSNKAQGYVLRRLLRRATVKLRTLSESSNSLKDLGNLSDLVIDFYSSTYFDKTQDKEKIKEVIDTEIKRFGLTIDRGLKEFEKAPPVTYDSPDLTYDDIDVSKDKEMYLDGQLAFRLYESFGFPIELTIEVAKEKGIVVPSHIYEQINSISKKHKELSRTASVGMFKGGLADHSETVTAYHTATHLLHASLRQILGKHVEQKGSNITSERLRFDFSHSEKISDDQLRQIENLINQKIAEKLPVTKTEEKKDEAVASGAMAFFGQKYPDVVNVYTIGDPQNFFSKELCGGPHVNNLSELANIKIVKQETLGAGVRRLYLQFV